jgi:hypothetical protein
MSQHHNIHKYTYPYGKIHSQIHYVMMDKRQHSGVGGVRSFSGADCGTDYYLIAAEVRKRLSVRK